MCSAGVAVTTVMLLKATCYSRGHGTQERSASRHSSGATALWALFRHYRAPRGPRTRSAILRTMLGIDRRALRVVWTVFLFALFAAAIYAALRTLVIFALALFLAHLIAPIAGFAEGFVPKRVPRGVVLAVVYILLLAAILSVTIAIGARVAEEAANLAGRLPQAMQQQDPLSHLPLPSWLEPMRARLTDLLRDRVNDLDRDVLPLLSQAGSQILTGIGNLLSVILIPILSFFFLKDGPGMRDAIVESFAPDHRRLVDDILTDLHVLLAQYIRALVILSLAAFVFYFGFLSAMSAPYAILLAGISAILEFIPVVGPLVASAIVLLVAEFSGYPHILWIALFLVLYRVFQDYVLNPYLMSSSTKIHPALVLFGVLAGDQIAGIPGMFFSVPVIAALRMMFFRLRRQRHAE